MTSNKPLKAINSHKSPLERRVEALEEQIKELKAEVARLSAAPAAHYHYHYDKVFGPQPPPAQPLVPTLSPNTFYSNKMTDCGVMITTATNKAVN